MYNLREMTNAQLSDSRDDVLRKEIRANLPNGSDWLKTPHALLGGQTPEQSLKDGRYDEVLNLVQSILYIGVS